MSTNQTNTKRPPVISSWKDVRSVVEFLRLFKRLFTTRHSDLSTRFSQLTPLAKLYCPEVRLTWPELTWCDNPDFNRFLDRFEEFKWYNTHRKWNVFQLLRLVENVEGHTAECGVFMGASSYLMAASNRTLGKSFNHHAFDSFQGLNAPGTEDGTHWAKDDLSFPLEKVREALSEFGENVLYHAGWIPDRFPDVEDQQFRFVHIDVDLYQPTLDSIIFFYPRLKPGGILVCDDYMFTTCPGATQACDEYLADKPEKMISLASGGGYLIKGIPTVSTLASAASSLNLS